MGRDEEATPEMQQDDLSSFKGLVATMNLLRSSQGCPWDREQTHRSLRHNLLEECYEALEAIDLGNPEKLAEELGDVLIQVVFHAQIGAEEGTFTIDDVIRSVHHKLRHRHPHVFGDVQVADSHEVKVNWDKIKRAEREGMSALDGVPSQMPALAYSQAVQDRASRYNFDWDSIEGVLEKVVEELRELEDSHSQETREGELGDVLFSIVNTARWLGVPAESALRGTNERFYRRFATMERLCSERGLDFASMPLAQKELLWEEAKGILRAEYPK